MQFRVNHAMHDILMYWRDYRRNLVEQVPRWHSNAKLIGELQPGDVLWMVTSGANLRQEAKQAGFLVAIWNVKEVVENPGDDPAYPKEDYRFRAIADESKSISFDEPVLVDHVLRPLGRDKAVSIGRFLQGPRKLTDEKVRLLRAAAGPDLALRWLKGEKA